VGEPEVDVPVVEEVDGPDVVEDVDCATVEAVVVAAIEICPFSQQKLNSGTHEVE
jgi:hypothetical protein